MTILREDARSGDISAISQFKMLRNVARDVESYFAEILHENRREQGGKLGGLGIYFPQVEKRPRIAMPRDVLAVDEDQLPYGKQSICAIGVFFGASQPKAAFF